MASNEDNYRRDSFSDRICDDLAKVILQYMSVEERNRLECVSKQFQRTVFATKICLDINLLYGLNDIAFFERFRNILDHFPNIEIISILGDVDHENHKKVKRLFDAIHYFCNNSTKFGLSVEFFPKIFIKRFFEKFGSNIIEVRISEPIPEVIASITESNVEKMVVTNDFHLILNEIQFKRLKYFEIHLLNTQDLDPLEVFIERNKHNFKHLEIYSKIKTDKQKTRLFDIISNLSNLVEFKLFDDFYIKVKPIF